MIRADYVWLDAEGNLRDKTKLIKSSKYIKNVDELPIWTFDGSSTGQAETGNSDLLLKPVKLYFYKKYSEYLTQHILVLCEVLNPDKSPHITNTRAKCLEIMNLAKDQELLFGIEQEYLLIEVNHQENKHIHKIIPYSWKHQQTPYYEELNGELTYVPQGKFYCGVGGVSTVGRSIIEEHIDRCLELDIVICGTNAEVMASQWEYQIGPISGFEIGDQLVVSRYLLKKVAEKYNADVTFHPKPIKGWNGSGGHTNFSTKLMREGSKDKTGLDYIKEACEKLAPKHKEHMEVYGKYNNERLCGNFETSNINKFSYGVADRSCSIRIPQHVNIDKKGYLEDRRPASNLDPYLVCGKLVETICL
jgi:glutamine synthetase